MEIEIEFGYSFHLLESEKNYIEVESVIAKKGSMN